MLHLVDENTISLQPKPKSYQMEIEGTNVSHFVALPNGTFSLSPPEYPEEPLLQYDFELDCFQKRSISCIHRNESVLVSAHTSSGKTAIAVYAIQAALKQNSRVIYTSPIKALSNQKYRDLKNQFGEVGLITGDVTIDASAPILVMTTEILRMMLYRGDSLIRELSWVIYDEIHYMKDPERGVVWEESIIMLPDAVRFVFLSATIPNAKEFSEWISYIHNQPCHVVYTERRPVPLKFFVSTPGSGKPVIVKDGEGFLNVRAIEETLDQVISKRIFKGVSVQSLPKSDSAPKLDIDQANAHIVRIADSVVSSDLAPMIVFAFGKKLCNDIASLFEGKSYVSPEESNSINSLIDTAIEKLDKSDKDIPQITTIRDLLCRGIGVHHGGLIPLMKELIELLFQHGLIKVLFTTETFAMGINMPARTVVFHSLIKFDGNQRRVLTGGEFIQMSGRAGRRNNDKFGAVVISSSCGLSKDQLIELLQASAQPLNSEFHVTYRMLLSLKCANMMNPEALMEKSFHQFQMEKELPELSEKNEKLLLEIKQFVIPNENIVKKHYTINEQVNHFTKEKANIVSRVDNMSPFIVPGRFVNIKKWGWGVVVTPISTRGGDFKILLAAANDSSKDLKPALNLKNAKVFVFDVSVCDIDTISDIVLGYSISMEDDSINRVFNDLKKKISDDSLHNIPESAIVKHGLDQYEKANAYITQMQNVLKELPEVDPLMIDEYRKKNTLIQIANGFKKRIALLKESVIHRDLKDMNRVLEHLGFVQNDGLITEKGRVASVIMAGDEITLTELLYDGVLNDQPPQCIAALLSPFAADEPSKTDYDIPEVLSEPWSRVSGIIEKVFQTSLDCSRNMNREEYMEKYCTNYMALTYNWACGASFSDIAQQFEDLFEGNIIRTMKRTEELLRQAQRAASAMGNTDLEIKILAAIQSIKRDIVFSSSLYL